MTEGLELVERRTHCDEQSVTLYTTHGDLKVHTYCFEHAFADCYGLD